MQLHMETPAPGPTMDRPPSLAEEVVKRLLDDRRVLLTGEVTDGLAHSICAQLLVAADRADTDHPVTLMINSPGGSVDAGFAIYDTMQTLGVPVATVAYGLAASMGQFLLVGGAPGLRYAHRHSQILMHQPHGQVAGYATDIRIHAEHFGRRRRLMAQLIAKHCGQDVETVEADMDRDHWFDAEDALAYGMVDHLVDGPLRL